MVMPVREPGPLGMDREIIPLPGAITRSLNGRKAAGVSPEELEGAA